jgi:hypothetical protein
MNFRLLLTIFLLISLTTFSQITPKNEAFVRCLSLQMTGHQKNINFFEGDNIKVKLHSDHKKHTFQIIKLTDSSFFYSPYEELNTVFDLQELKFRDIKKIYLGGSRNPISMSGFGALGGAGVMLSSFDILNQLRTGATIKINPTIAGVSVGLIGLSYLVKILTNPIYKINKRHFFRLYHLSYSSPLLRAN